MITITIHYISGVGRTYPCSVCAVPLSVVPIVASTSSPSLSIWLYHARLCVPTTNVVFDSVGECRVIMASKLVQSSFHRRYSAFNLCGAGHSLQACAWCTTAVPVVAVIICTGQRNHSCSMQHCREIIMLCNVGNCHCA
jgi:hypothetical protein